MDRQLCEVDIRSGFVPDGSCNSAFCSLCSPSRRPAKLRWLKAVLSSYNETAP
jgi:hypothetical protein